MKSKVGADLLEFQTLPDGRMDAKSASSYLGVAASTLAAWRTNGEGPEFTKIGSRVYYFRADLDAFIEAGRQAR